VIYDIFGYYPQTLQGADILSTSNDHQKYLVFVPDFFEGKPADISWYPPDNEDKKKKLGEFFSGIAAPPKNAAKVPDLVKAIGEKYSGIKSWGILGVSILIVPSNDHFTRKMMLTTRIQYCWGGKIVSLTTSDSSTIFSAAAECHPAMVDPKDAEKIKIPLCMLASKDEPAEDVKKFEENLTTDKHVETFSDQVHGYVLVTFF
jgi:dienelactone hydrolase